MGRQSDHTQDETGVKSPGLDRIFFWALLAYGLFYALLVMEDHLFHMLLR